LNPLLGLRKDGTDPDCIYSKEKYLADAKIYFDMIGSLKSTYGDKVIILDYTDFYCQENGGKSCGTSYNGNAIYGYTDHISSFTAGIVGKSINQRLRRFGGR